MYIWLGGQVNPNFVQSLFGVQTGHIQPEKVNIAKTNLIDSFESHIFQCRIVDLDNPISRNVRTLLNMIRNERNSHMKVSNAITIAFANLLFVQLFVIQQRDSIEPFFKNYLVEDKGFTGGASYVDFLYHLHREIRNILQ